MLMPKTNIRRRGLCDIGKRGGSNRNTQWMSVKAKMRSHAAANVRGRGRETGVERSLHLPCLLRPGVGESLRNGNDIKLNSISIHHNVSLDPVFHSFAEEK